ncbi:hypothetical protein B0H11DRAFT_2236248 [Mycena galericulata]|nr:hypothetical protein B0H11DRAFT_2236248 [Mycena galericulata]
MNNNCWYSDPNPATNLRWLVGTQLFWLLAMASLEVIFSFVLFSFVLVLFMIRRHNHQRVLNDVRAYTRQPRSLNPPHRSFNTAARFCALVRLHSLASHLLVLTLDRPLPPLLLRQLFYQHFEPLILQIPDNSELLWRLDLLALCITSLRPFFCACLAATDPSFLRAVRSLRTVAASGTSSRPKSWVSSVTWRNSTGSRLHHNRPFSLNTKALVHVELERVTDGSEDSGERDRDRDSEGRLTVETHGVEMEILKEEAEMEAGGDAEKNLNTGNLQEQDSRAATRWVVWCSTALNYN